MAFVDVNSLSKSYSLIYSDPPWQQSKGGLRTVRPNQYRRLYYNTMSLSDIHDFHAPIFLNNVSYNHNVFIWTLDKFIHDTENMMASFGYKLHARIIWDKTNGVAPAFTLRFSHEYLLWFYLPGRMLLPRKDKRAVYTTVIREKSLSHSCKPIAAYLMLEDLFLGNKLELFARKGREGWDFYGDDPCLPSIPS